jgi:hypothetical protein
MFSKEIIPETKEKEKEKSTLRGVQVAYLFIETNSKTKPTVRSRSFSGKVDDEEDEMDFPVAPKHRRKPSLGLMTKNNPLALSSPSLSISNSRSASTDSQDGLLKQQKASYSSDSADETKKDEVVKAEPMNAEQNLLKHQFVLVENLLERKFEVATALCHEISQQEDDVVGATFTEALLNFFEGYGRLLPFLQHLIGLEIEQTCT